MCDVVALGESMVAFRPRESGGLAGASSYERGIGGAESNVACALAAAGHRVKWVSRVGADGFGRYLARVIASYGVDTGEVQRDPRRPTGIYFRTAGERSLRNPEPAAAHPAHGDRAHGAPVCAAGQPHGARPDEAQVSRTSPGRTGADPAGKGTLPPSPGPLAEVLYYRSGSAAAAMSRANMPGAVLRSGRILHLTGITAALSPDCRDLLHALTERPVPPGPAPLLSFDVNHRVGLWRDGADPGAVLLGLARRCDLVFVGDDEAEAAWGLTGGPAAIRAALPEPRLLVVKQGAAGVTVFHRSEPALHGPGPGRAPAGDRAAPPRPPASDTATFVPALRVDVVAPVGAGDAFAAGFLSATLRGLPVRDRARHGHLTAAAVLTVPGDLVAPATPAQCRDWRATADRLAALDDAQWGRLQLGPGWTRTATARAQGTGERGEECGP